MYKRQVLARARESGLKAADVTDFKALPGNGLSAVLDGALLCGGNLAFIGGQAEITPEMETQADRLAQGGKTPLFFSRDGRMAGIIAVSYTHLGNRLFRGLGALQPGI